MSPHQSPGRPSSLPLPTACPPLDWGGFVDHIVTSGILDQRVSKMTPGSHFSKTPMTNISSEELCNQAQAVRHSCWKPVTLCQVGLPPVPRQSFLPENNKNPSHRRWGAGDSQKDALSKGMLWLLLPCHPLCYTANLETGDWLKKHNPRTWQIWVQIPLRPWQVSKSPLAPVSSKLELCYIPE